MSAFDAIIANADAHERRMLAASRETLEGWAEETTEWERANRPWTDRSKHARQGLTFVRQYPDDPREPASVALVHGAEHGVFLETSNGSQYAIIQPAVAVFGPKLVQDLKQEVWH